MQVQIITKPRFAVLGIEGRGPAESGPEWIRPLWAAAFSRIEEIEALITGAAWGLMSAVDEPFGRWKEEGKYLAGWEVPLGTPAPEGWTLWTVPETTFAAIACTMATYDQAWQTFQDQFLPHETYEPGGAVHEYYPPGFQNPEKDTLYLYFTLKDKEGVGPEP
jgi:predicted transcriptional regulator YdeE